MNSEAICLAASAVAADRSRATPTDVGSVASELQQTCSTTPYAELVALVEHSVARLGASPQPAGIPCGHTCRRENHGPFTRLLCLSRGLMLQPLQEERHV